MRLLLWLISRIIPHADRPRWREEWGAELRHGGWRMLPGMVPDALMLRKIGRENRRHARVKRVSVFHGRAALVVLQAALCLGLLATRGAVHDDVTVALERRAFMACRPWTRSPSRSRQRCCS